jgi:hypothetical protein
MSTDTKAPEQGLEKAPARTPEVITSSEEFKSSMALWASRQYHILTPFTSISGLAPQHGIMTSLVKLDPNKEAGEVYDGLPFLKKDEVAIAKIGLRKLAECAGISYRTEIIKTGVRFHWIVKCIASYRGVDGSVIQRDATKEWDLTDGSPQLKGWTENQVSEGRKHGLRNCEARAINAAIRECGCGIKQKYLRADLAKPFVICRVSFRADMNDPDQKRMVLERALGSTAQLYPSAPAALSAHQDRDDEGGESFQASEPRSVGRGSTQQPQQMNDPAGPPAADTTEAKKADKPADAPPSENAVKVTSVKSTKGTKDTAGPDGQIVRKPWEKWDISVVDQQGQAKTYSTFSSTLADDAIEARDGGFWVDVTTETKGAFTNITAIERAQASLLPDASDL